MSLKSARIFVSPNYEEGWDIADSDAMACGLAIVRYNLSVYKIFGDDDIINIDVGDKQAILQSVAPDLLISNHMEMNLSQRGKELVDKKSDWDDISAE